MNYFFFLFVLLFSGNFNWQKEMLEGVTEANFILEDKGLRKKNFIKTNDIVINIQKQNNNLV